MLFSRQDLKRLVIPLLLEQLLVVLIGLADTVMVSSVGEAAVSGVSLVDTINILLIGVFSSMATGGAVVCSQYLGKKDLPHATIAAKMLFYVILICSCGLMILCLLFRGPVLQMIFGHIEPEVMQAGQTYFLLSALSYPFLGMYNGSCALLRAQGNTKATLYSSVAMNIINVCGNYITIHMLGWGVFGAGLATLISRAVGAVVTQVALRDPHCQIPYPRLLQLQWHRSIVGKILSVGLPNGFENGLFQMGKLVLARLISTFGTVSIAANAVGNSVAGFQVLPGQAISLAMITVVGRCVGAKAFDQARHYTKKLMLLAYGTMSALNIVMLVLTPWIVSMFNLSGETAQLAQMVCMIHGIGAIFMWPMSFTFPNALRAAGDTRYTMTVSMLSMLICRLAASYLLAQAFGMGLIGVWVAMQLDWVIRIICFVVRWKSGKWETKVLV